MPILNVTQMDLTMNISASGVLLRAAKIVGKDRDWGHLEWSLITLYKHLQEMKRMKEAGQGEQALNRFFDLWTQFEQEVE